VNATSYTVNSSTKITAVAPPHAVGTVQVRVTTGGGSTADTATDNYTYTVVPTRYEQTDGHLVYSGTWYTYSTTSAYGSSYRRANTKGSSVTIHYNGTRFDWIGMKGTSTGKADVYLDNGFQTTINLANSVAVYKQMLWSVITSPGYHKVEIRWYPQNTIGKYITLDAVNLVGTLTYAPPTITSLTPPVGPTDGGLSVTINGTGFGGLSGPSAVTFGGERPPAIR
jgi:hypothetical protein